MIEQQIIDYLFTNSNGKIDLPVTHARAIVKLVIGADKPNTAIALLHRIDAQTKNPVLVRTIATTDEKIKVAIIKALETKPDMDFYYYKLYNSCRQYEGCIYSSNPNIF